MFGESGVRDGRTFVFPHGQHGQIAIGRQLRQCVGRSVGLPLWSRKTSSCGRQISSRHSSSGAGLERAERARVVLCP
jgi:hypothetical protein